MKKEKDSINRLTSKKSKVSSHYLIKRNGDIIIIVPDLFIAWHAGQSNWKSLKNLNKNSIGIEISNPGHQYNYKKFSQKQIKSILYLSKYLIRKYKISSNNILGHSDIAPTRKKDPGEKFPWEFLSKYKIGIWHSLTKKKLKINRFKKVNFKIEKTFYKNIKKIGYKFFKSKNLNQKKNFYFINQIFSEKV